MKWWKNAPLELFEAATTASTEVEAYHSRQIAVLAGTAADMVAAFTMTYAEEAVGITRAARRAGMPVAISFTLETDGRLPSGQPLGEAIARVDATTDGGPDYDMINCAHPTHFAHVLADAPAWTQRIRGLRANASTRSHAELDEATELDAGDPHDLGARYPRAPPPAAEPDRAGRLLRHRPPARRGDRRGLGPLTGRGPAPGIRTAPDPGRRGRQLPGVTR